MIAGSSEEDHKEQFEIDAIVLEPPKETSSWLWGSKTTCRVRYVMPQKPEVVLGADPSSDRARLTILASIPLGPLGNKKTRIQLYETDVRAFVVSRAKKSPAFEIKVDSTCGSCNEDELALILILNSFVIRVSSKVRIALSGATGNWDASYNLNSAELNRGSIRIPIKLCLDEKSGLRLKIGSSMRVRFGDTRCPKLEFIGNDSDSSMYEVLTNVIASAMPKVLENVRSEIEQKARATLSGREIPLLSWSQIGVFVNKNVT